MLLYASNCVKSKLQAAMLSASPIHQEDSGHRSQASQEDRKKTLPSAPREAKQVITG